MNKINNSYPIRKLNCLRVLRGKILLLGVVLLSLLACDHPFKAGLGPVEDVRPPTVTLESPGAGEYIYGLTTFKGSAEDDYRLVSVEIMVVNYPDYPAEEFAFCHDYVPTILTIDVNKGKWEYTIDTTKFPDGDFKIQLRAFDSVNKKGETDPIVFMVSNSLPAITVSMPYIARGSGEGDVGSAHLNYQTVDGPLPNGLTFQRQMNKGGNLSGTISHDEDIYLGKADEATDRYPPQVRLWKVANDAVGVDSWKPGVLPPESAVPWVNLSLEDETLMGVSLGVYQFLYPVPQEVGCFYGFEMRAQTKPDRSRFHYPRDFYPPRDWNAGGDFEKENRYVLFYVRTPRELPKIDLYGFENILGAGAWNGSSYDLVPEAERTEPHLYIDKDSKDQGKKINKNGDFILRFKAWHTEGIRSAEVYWERDGQRGRFIWDLANTAPYPSWSTALVAASEPYSFWGYRDPYVADTRNFVFTYRHGGVNSVPNGAGYNEQVRGHSRIQQLRPGNDAAWAVRKDGTLPMLSQTASANIWEDITELPEGEYSIEAYTRSINDMANTVPATGVFRLDRTEPEMTITLIEGARDFDPSGTTKVNGVIRPQLRIVETGSGPRIKETVPAYFSPYEQRYIVIPAANIAALTALINSEPNWWPDPARDGQGGGIPTAIIAKHGPVVGSTFKFKTSNIYYGNDYPNKTGLAGLGLSVEDKNIPETGETLPNGEYYLYVFARDYAFNVGKTSMRFAVDHLSDFPDFDFSQAGITLDVKNPNQAADNASDGFKPGGTTRNKLSPGAFIRVGLQDDDSLDLGMAGTGASNDSKVRITFAGSQAGTGGTITEWPALTLSQTMIKNIFVVQPEGPFAGRSAVTSRSGTINQGDLLAVMKGDNVGSVNYNGRIPNLASYTSLPDGIYHFTMTAADYAPAKLIIEGEHGSAAAAVAQKTVDFWIAVDTVAPDVSAIDPPSGNALNFNTGTGLSTIEGKVSDQNGPIKGEVVNVRRAGGGDVPFTGGISYAAPRPTDPANPGLWMENFTANITLAPNIASETYIFELRFTDRFDSVRNLELRYTLDKTPPDVALLTPMKTFSRSVVPAPDSERLANGIVSFAATAKDTGGVAELRWWLLPDGEEPTGWDYLSINTGPENTTNNLGTNQKGGRTTTEANFAGKPWYVSTVPLTGPTVQGLADGRYNLYVAAEDKALNKTNFTNIAPLQTIYVLQEHDLPWFGAANNIKPNEASGSGVIGSSGAVVRGSIYEDDGFFEANGTTIRTDSISIWMSSATDAGSIPLTNVRGTTPAYTTYGYVKGTIPAGAIDRASGSNNLSLLINLRNIAEFNSILSGDGRKHYIIEARDSYVGKFTNESGTTATVATDLTEKVRRQHFSFVYDFQDPVIKVTSPAQDTTFGANSHLNSSAPRNFALSAAITDAYLETLSGNYYIAYRLNTSGDSSGEFKTLDLGVSGTGGSSSVSGITIQGNTPATPEGERTLSFTLTAEKLNELINYAALESGDYSLYLQVKDQSGKTGNTVLNFHKDKDPPSFTFTSIEKQALPLIGGSNWWASGTTNFAAKRAALEAMPANGKIPVLQYEGTTVTIEGTITDALSNVDNASFKYYFDERTVANTMPAGSSAAVTITGTGKNVNWRIALTNVPDGVHSLRIEVADVGGNTLPAGTDYYGFILVTKRPTVAIDTLNGTQTTAVGTPPVRPVPPTLLMGDYNAAKAVQSTDAVFVIGGESTSPSLASVTLKISYPGSTAWSGSVSTFTTLTYPATAAVAYLETGTWSYTVTRANLYSATGMSATSTDRFKEGTYELSAVTVDKSGNLSEESSWSFIVDSAKPKIEFTSPGKKIPDATPDPDPATVKPTYWLSNLSLRNVIMSDEPKLQASISDKNTLRAAQYQIRRFNYAGGTGTPPNGAWGDYYNGTTGSTVAEAASWINIDIPASAGTDFAWELSITNLPDGYYYARVRARDTSVLYQNTATDKDKWENVGDGNPGDSRYAYFFLSRTPPNISHVDENKTSFSSRVINGNRLEFAINAVDPTWFEKLDITVESQNTTTPYTTVIPSVILNTGNPLTNSYGNVTTGWGRTVNIEFPTTLKDGSYRIKFTVTNLAGRTSEKSRNITLDNTPPIGTVAMPQTVNAAWSKTTYTYPPHVAGITIGETLYGGEDEAIINGTTDDKGDNGSASGVAEIWYHLGYVGTAANNEPNGPLAFPTETTVRSDGVTGLTLIGGNDLGGSANNARFDAAARDLTTAWFKYDPSAIYPVPHGVASHGTDLINWEFIVKKNISEIANYAKANFTLKTGSATRYNNAAGAWMVKKINPAATSIPATVSKNGLYSLPLWVRVADTAGNVRYFCHDIWLYPNGDYPSNIFSNPTDNQDQNASKGGQFSVEGKASDNRSIKKVIYRVFADNVSSVSGSPTYNANWRTVVPADNKIVFLTGLTDVPSAEFGTLPTHPAAASPFGPGKLSTTGWYYATLESGTPAPEMPWSFIINAQNEITDMLNAATGATDGRWFESGGNKYTRLYIQVFAFDGYDSGANNYNKISLGGDDENNPQPDVRVLYVTSSAPTITNLILSDTSFGAYTGTTPATQNTYFTTPYDRTDNLRSKRFAVRMTLNSGSTTRNITEINVQRSGGGESTGWKGVWKAGDALSAGTTLPITGEGAGVYLSSTDTSANARNITMTYSFDSLINAAATGFAPVLAGDWKTTGGTFTVEVQIKDNATPPGEAIARFDIALDNFAPVADPRPGSTTPGKVAGTNASFIGRVFDYEGRPNAASPAHRGIDRVLVWFTTNANGTAGYINLNESGTAVATTTMSARRGRTAEVVGTGDTITSVTLTNSGGDPVNVTYPNPASASSVDYLKTLSAATSGNMANQITWQPTTDHDILWNFIADTTKMPDGRIYLNYLVVDKAGNASYYQQNMVVMNKYPQITNVTLRTDNMGVGAVFTTHEGDVAQNEYTIPDTPFTSGYLDSGFISKNQFIAFGVDAIGGNGNLNYRVQYVKRIPITLSRANLIKMANKDYTNNGADIGNTSLYTIASKGNVDDYTWGVLGVPVTRPSAGNHFVFQAALGDVNTLQDFNGTVYGYQTIGTAPRIEKTAPNAGNSVPITINETTLGPLNFQGATYFGTGANQILETNATNGATAFFLIKVWDTITDSGVENDMLYDAVVVGMQVYLTDGTFPTARLYDLNPYTETAVVNNNFDPVDRTDTISAAADPIAIGSNILRGGLFNVKTERDVIKSGYIDPRNGTTALNPDIQDPNTSLWRATRADGFITGDVNTGGPTRDKVSGKVILRGVAWDDQFVKEIRIRISGTGNTGGTEKAILQLTDLNAAGNPVTGTEAVARREMRAASGEQAFAYEELHWKNGHTVEWAYVWDTEKEPDSAGGRYQDNITITVSVIDRNGTGGGLTSAVRDNLTNEATTRVYHNTIPVDIVPYVVGFERASQYSTIRSRQGWYSFFQGEPGIALLGYNLATDTVAPGIAYTTTTTNPGTTMGSIAVNNDATRFPFPLRYTFTVPTGAVSGKINVTVTGATGVTPATSRLAYNHDSSNTNKSWNGEKSVTTGSDLWINKPHAHIWRTTENSGAPRTYFNGSDGPTSPGMALEYNGTQGRLHAAWTSFGDATYYYGHNGADSRVAMQPAPSGDPFSLTDISLFNGTGIPNMSVVYQNDGSPYVALRTTMTAGGTASNQEHRNARISAVVTATAGDPTGANARASERWGHTRIAKAAPNAANNPASDPYAAPGGIDNSNLNPGGNDFRTGRTYMTAYDSQGKYLWFGMRYSSANDTYNNYTRIIDGNRTSATATPSANMDRTDAISTETDTSSSAGEFSAVDYDGTGPVIAYYDKQNDTVRIALGTLGAGEYASITGWTRRELLPSNHALYKGSGQYISIKVDKNNGIHLAIYNSIRQTVVYAYMTSRTATAAQVTAYTVDNVIQGGTWTDISVDNYGNPMIVYGNTSRMNNYDGVRIAYKNSQGTEAQTGQKFTGTLNCPVTGTSIAGWEAVSMPASYTIKRDRFNIEVWPPTNRNTTAGTDPAAVNPAGWNAAIGYASDLFRIGYFYYPTYKGY
jgi:hypothetical protein